MPQLGHRPQLRSEFLVLLLFGALSVDCGPSNAAHGTTPTSTALPTARSSTAVAPADVRVVEASNAPCTTPRAPGSGFETEVGPALVDGDTFPDVARVTVITLGDAAMGGSPGGTTYAVERKRDGDVEWHRIYEGQIPAEGNARLRLVDLNHDRRAELFVSEQSGFMDCDMEGGGGSTTWVLLDGAGRELFRSAGGSRSYTLSPTQIWDRTESAVVVRLPSGADAIALRAPARLRVLSSEVFRVEAENFIRCDNTPATTDCAGVRCVNRGAAVAAPLQ